MSADYVAEKQKSWSISMCYIPILPLLLIETSLLTGESRLLPWCAGSAWKLLEKAAYAVATYRWLSPASFSSTLIVCPRP